VQVHKHFFHHLFFSHMELDELRTALRDKTHELWVWVVLDAHSKVISVLCLEDARKDGAWVIHGLCQLPDAWAASRFSPVMGWTCTSMP